MADDNKGNFYTSLDALASDFVEYADADVRAKYRDNPLEYFREFHDFKLPPILEWIFNKIYTAAKVTVDGGDRSNGLDIIICAARGGGKSLFASMLEFALWYFLDADCINMAGSEDQATIVYNYVCSYIDADGKVGSVVDKRTMSMTTKKGQAPTPELRCVSPDTYVRTNNSVIQIKDINVGDKVLTSSREYKTVLGKSIVKGDKDWYEIKVFGNNTGVKMTFDHEVLTQRGFIRAEELTKNDYVLTPVPKNTNFKIEIPWFESKSKHQYSNKLEELKKIDYNNPEFWRLVGYYISEGSSHGAGGSGRGRSNKYRRISFSLSTNNDQHIIEDIKRLSNEYFLIEPNVFGDLIENDSKRMVMCSISPFQDFFAQFGSSAKTKTIPFAWLGADNECLAQLIRGLWEGDGWVPKGDSVYKRNHIWAYYGTTSKNLAIWVQMALSKLGILATINKKYRAPSVLVKAEGIVYHVVIRGVLFLKFLETVYGIPIVESEKQYNYKGHRKVQNEIKDGFVHSRVREISKLIEKDLQCDIEVEGVHDFCTDIGIVHNCVTASAKQVRGKHPGARRKAPGLLVIDEAAEVPDGLMKQALPMTKEARPPFNLMVSTFHHAFGDFQDFWDNAEARGFLKISMDSFDVCEKCVDDCTKCIPEFDETYCQLVCGCYFNFETPRDQLPVWVRFHYQERLDETRLDQKPANCIYPKLCNECPHRETCGAIRVKIKQAGDFGRICEACGEKVDHKARRGNGHFPVEEVRKAWRRNDKVTFEVEYMGWRPGRGIFVLDPYEIDKAIVPDERVRYQKGYGSTFLGIDWGAAGTTAMSVCQYMSDEFVNVISYHSLNAPSDTDCYQLIADLAKQYNISMVLPDSSHVFQNMHVQKELGLPVNPINFTVQKEAGVGAMRMKFERRQVRIPERYKQTLAKDLKNWRRDVNGNIIKKNDHGPDSLLCAMINSASFGSAATYYSEDDEKVRKSYFDRWSESIF